MSILKSEDLFAVYQPETGFVQGVTITSDLTDKLDKTTGEVYNVTTSVTNTFVNGEDIVDDGEELEAFYSMGSGAQVSIKVVAGVIVDLFITKSGSGYIVNEIIVPDTGTGAVLIVTEVGEGGEVINLSLYLDNGGEGLEIQNGLLTSFPFDTHEELMALTTDDYGTSGNFLNFGISDGTVSFSTRDQLFPTEYSYTSSPFTVGQEVHILANRFVSGDHIPLQISSVFNVSAGGISKYNVDQLKSDVKEWASELDVTLDVDVVSNPGTYDYGGDLSYDESTGKLTYTKSYNPPVDAPIEVDVTLSNDYGFILDVNGAFTSDAVSTQEELNQKFNQRLGFLEKNLYEPTTIDKINHDTPHLIEGTTAESVGGASSEVATRMDITDAQSLAAAASLSIENLLQVINESATFAELKETLFPPEIPDENP